MKIIKSFLYGMMALATLGGFASCQDDIDAPEMTVPEATLQANTTIFDFKKEFWDDATNYIKKVPAKPDGSHYIVKGRVITSDEAGNIFKSVTIQDETAALPFSVNTYNLFLDYRIGQEIVVDLTDMYIGKYNGLQQMGWPEWYAAGNAWEATFMAPQFFYSHVQKNGLPEADKVIVHELTSISDIPSGVDGLVAWQGQLVRCNNIKFVPKATTTSGETVTTFGIYKTNCNQAVELGGTEITLRVSGYADYVNEKMPTEPCDAYFYLSYYGTGWQLMLMNTTDIINQGNPTLPKGTEDNPYSVEDAIAEITAGATPQGWVQGYIVGTVARDVTTVSSNADIDWGTDAELASTVVIAPTADCTDFTKCFIVPLPTGSAIRNYVAVRNHPENVGKLLSVLGTLDHYLGTYGLVGNNGTAAEFKLEGVDVPVAEQGTQENPFTCADVIAMAPSSTTQAVKDDVWVSGYIVGYYKDYAGHFETAGAAGANILISADPKASDVSQCVCIQLVNGTDVRKALNLIDNPGNLGKQVKVRGDVMKYNSLPGIKNTDAYELDGQGGDTPVTPTGDVVFEETFASGDGGFTIDNVTLPSAATYIWKYDTSYHYWKASAYISGTSYKSDSWVISPAITLPSAAATLTFDHCTNKFPSAADAKRLVSVAVRVDGGAWQTLSIPTFSDNASWTFVNSGNISLAPYAGKKIELGFHYTSEDGVSGTWEFKNIKITK